MTGLWITVGVLAAASLLGLLLRSRDGLIRWARVGTPSRDGGEPPVAKLPEPVRELLDPATPVTHSFLVTSQGGNGSERLYLPLVLR